MTTPEFDIAIRGAGPVGSALALILARHAPDPARIALIGTLRTGPDPVATDPRTLALNYGSRQTLESLGAWPAQAATISTVHVSQAGRLGRTLITPGELGVPELGSVVGYDALLARLHAAVSVAGITCIAQATTAARQSSHIGFESASGPFSSRVCIQSDGKRPTGVDRTYNQHAILAMIQAGQPRPGWAFERFTREGPLAMLPHPAGPAIHGLVWCCSPQAATERAALDAPAFLKALREQFGDRLGRLELLGERHVYPLELHAGPTRTGPRTLAIGNAAQTLHPVAGQGLNLGLRDAAQLARTLAPWLAKPDNDPDAFLHAYTDQRRPDRWLTAAITDTLPRIFTTGNPWVEHACGLALLSMDLCQPLRMPLARHLLQGLRT